MKKSILISAIVAIAVIVFLCLNVTVIDKGTEAQYTGVVEFDASSNSENDWEKIVEEITANAVDITTLEPASLGDGKAIILNGTITDYVSKANGKKNSLVVTPEGYTGTVVFSVQIGSIYTGTSVRDVQTLKAFGDFTNQTEWSQYAKALNTEVDERIVAPLSLGEDCKGKTVQLIGAATAVGDEVTITPVAMVIQ